LRREGLAADNQVGPGSLVAARGTCRAREGIAMKVRTTWATVVAVLALAIPLSAFGGSHVAHADNGDPVFLGTSNYASSPTYVLMNSTTSSTREAAFVAGHQADANDVEPIGIWGDAGNSLFARPVGFQIGVLGTSEGDGVMGVAARNGVFGLTSNNGASGVYGENDGTGYGVAGRATAGTGVFAEGLTGMLGQSVGAGDGVGGRANNSCCSAVYGLNNGTGNGVAGRADAGTGVLAASTAGTALRVTGKAVFSRSGVVTVAAGNSSRVVTLAGVTASSMVLATAQQAKAVYVKAVVPAAGSFKIFLTGNAPTGGLKVAYFVLN
jgi:hypothetical protein